MNTETEFESAMIITVVQCANCKQGLAPTQPLMVNSKEDALAAGALLHRNSTIICSLPKLVIMYQSCFVDKALVVDSMKPLTDGNK